jgi:hypothetical protein
MARGTEHGPNPSPTLTRTLLMKTASLARFWIAKGGVCVIVCSSTPEIPCRR